MGMLKMGKNCSVCKEWQEHCYWSHMADDNKHFLKHMVGDFTESMVVPARFASNFNGHISEEVNLKPPSGKTWGIGVANSDAGEVVLQAGWKEFVGGNSIEEGDCLLFRYSGVSSFDVLIFDPSGCEKASPHFVENHGLGRAERSAGADGGGRNGRRTPPIVDGGDNGHRHLEMTLHRNSSRSRSIPRACKHSLFSDEIDEDQREAKENDDEDEDEDEDVVAAAEGRGYYFSRHGRVAEYNLREEDREEISRVTVPVEPGNPVFVQGVSPEFAGKYLAAVEREVVLERASRRGEWHVLFVHRQNTRGFYGAGWHQFARDNGLVAHDVCLFELLMTNEAGNRRRWRRRPTMTVHVLRRVRGRFVLLR